MVENEGDLDHDDLVHEDDYTSIKGDEFMVADNEDDETDFLVDATISTNDDDHNNESF